MCSESDFEKLLFMYKTQDDPKGVFINKLCVINNVPYVPEGGGLDTLR